MLTNGEDEFLSISNNYKTTHELFFFGQGLFQELAAP